MSADRIRRLLEDWESSKGNSAQEAYAIAGLFVAVIEIAELLENAEIKPKIRYCTCDKCLGIETPLEPVEPIEGWEG